MNNDSKQNFLFVINTSTYFSGLINIALLCNSKSQYKSVIYFDGEYPTIKLDIKLCQEKNIAFFVRDTDPIQKKPVSKYWSRLFSVLVNVLKIRLFKTILNFHEERRSVKKILNYVKPKLVILGGDNVWYDTATFIQKAHKLDIPAIIFAQWMASPNEPAEYVFNDPAYSMKKMSNKIMGRLYPKWLLCYKEKRLLRLPADRVLIKELFGLAPPQPWVLHSGNADLIALESQAMQDYCTNEHLPANKLVVTGSIDHDLLYQVKRNRNSELNSLYEHYQLSPKLPIILTALPADFLYIKGGRPECEFTRYDDLIQFWIKSLVAQKNFHVLVCPHPSVYPESVKYIEQFGAKIMTDRIMKYIPLCDIFVAACSSVIQWAIACGIPVINYDVFKFRYHDYDNVNGVIYVTQKNDFTRELSRLSNDRGHYQQKMEAQKQCSHNWGILDGNSGTRILSLINKTINHNKQRVPASHYN